MDKIIMSRLKILLALIPIFTFFGCDAMLSMRYTVENNSLHDAKLFVPNFPLDTSNPGEFSESRDTTLILRPNTKIIVGVQNKLDFPWATKNIYKKSPGKCGIIKIEVDTIIHLGCSESEWEYDKGRSNFKLH
jgi:hypothetical protein